MDYSDFKDIFNRTIFEESKSALIRKMAEQPYRYVGLFRPTKPKSKIFQNLTQSHEIRFGDAFEILIEKYFEAEGATVLNKKFKEANGKRLEIDQVFSYKNNVYFIEQKVRDDHDSSKKSGQIENFEKKVKMMLQHHGSSNMEGFFYFIDDSLNKNKRYYEKEIPTLSKKYDIPLHLMYGEELFRKFDILHVWKEILKHLTKWKESLPEMTEINFDKHHRESFDEIKTLEPLIFKKLFSNEDLDDFLRILFPQRKVLNLLQKHLEKEFHNSGKKQYEETSILCEKTIERI